MNRNRGATLHDTWKKARARYVQADASDSPDWAALFAAEQDAYDALVDYVEAHGLNYSELDPRGALTMRVEA